MNCLRLRSAINLFLTGLFLLLLVTAPVLAQHIRGAIEGTVADPNGAVVALAKVTARNVGTNTDVNTTTNKAGVFSLQNLEPGEYTVTIEQQGFRTSVVKNVIVKVGAVTPVNQALQIGETTAVVEITANTEAVVDNVRSTVDGVVNTTQIDNLPLNGRNFLDLAQLEPGVQTRDGGDFDPTKNQFVGVSVAGRSGRTTRIQVDGVDITDETVGTTTANISNEAIQEFQISRSTLDASTDLSSSGAVNIVTRSGSNNIHGAGFGFFRDSRFAADTRLDKTQPTAEKPPFDRQIFGGRAGGFFIKNKLFWHAEYERNNQDNQQNTNAPSVFPQFTGSFAVPLDERMTGGRLDWNVKGTLRSFYRFTHNDNLGVTGFGGPNLAAFANRNNTNSHVAGLDYSTSRWTHSVRFSYLNFNNHVVEATKEAGVPSTLDPAGNPILVALGPLLVGPFGLAPQATFQDNKQLKYDASFVRGSHTMRFGSSYNRIIIGGFANTLGVAPAVIGRFANVSFAASHGGVNDPLSYQLAAIQVGNGLGFATEKPAHGLPFGGAFNHRLAGYFQDSWRTTARLTINFGLRYNFDSIVADNDIRRADKLAEFNPVLGGFIDRPSKNFAPQVGFAWDPWGTGKTVIRGGAGIFYDTNLVGNQLGDRILNLPPGVLNQVGTMTAGFPILSNPETGACLFDIRRYNSTPGVCTGGVNLLLQPMRDTIAAAQNIQLVFQRISAEIASRFPTPGAVPTFDTILSSGNFAFIYNEYSRPYSMQFNIGVQRELKPGLVVSVDYIRNRGLHFGQFYDMNRVGAADTLDPSAATDVINLTADTFRPVAALPPPCLGSRGSSAINCLITNHATITTLAVNGLDRGFAFPGENPNYSIMNTIAPMGISLYNALTVSLRGRLGNFGPLRQMMTTVSYALSRSKTSTADQDAGTGSVFNDETTKFFGPSGLDRTHQLTFSLLSNLPLGFKFNTTTRVASPLSTSILLPFSGLGPGEIFFTDLNGDGTTSDPLPGTNRGSFGRDVNIRQMNGLISSYNSLVDAKNFTPAAQALISAGLFTADQLRALGATVGNNSRVALAPADQAGLDVLNYTDVRLSRVFSFGEHLKIEPMIEVFNLFNIGNYDAPGNRLAGGLSLESGVGSDFSTDTINGTHRSDRSNRFGLGTGAFAPGIPRAFQFGFRAQF